MSEEVKEEPQAVTEEEDENPLKPRKRRVNFVMTPAREATLRRGREKRASNVRLLQEAKKAERDASRALREKIKDEITRAQSAPPSLSKDHDPFVVYM